MKASLIIPAYNEETRLKPFLVSIQNYLQRTSQIGEIIVVDDGSSDKTAQIVRDMMPHIPELKLVVHPVNKGKGAAVKTGIMSAQEDVIIFMDADGATDISELPKMCVALEEAEIGIGNRWMKGAQTKRHSWIRRLSGWAYRMYMKLVGLGPIDTMCGFKGYHRAVARELFEHLLEERWLFDTEISYKAVKKGYTIKNFPIAWESKDGSKLSTGDLLKSAFSILPLIRRINHQLHSLEKQHASV